MNIPAFYNFITLKQGYLSYAIDSAKMSRDNYNILVPGETASDRTEAYSFQSNTSYHLWAIQNVPALKEEEFTTTLGNHVSKMDFQLLSIEYPNTPPRPYMQNWYDMAKELMKDENFGEPLTHENNWLNDDVKKATAAAKDNQEKTKNIFEYVRDNFTCTDSYSKYLSQSLKKTYQSHKGNVADINILLAAMLQNSGFEVHPALLSTRDHGVAYELHPIMSKFNYVITQAKSGDKIYLLDASDPNIGFNCLPAKCYNGNARLIADEPYWLIFLQIL